MKKLLIVFYVGLLASCSITVNAQRNTNTTWPEGSTYRTALGVKVWADGGGVSIKQFVGFNHSIEGIGYFWTRGARITGLYEFNFDIEGAPGLKWYVGPGVHLGVYNDRYYRDQYPNGNGTHSFAGIDGVLGLDYKFQGVPINLSLDWQPSFEFGDNRGFIGSWGGLGVRYTFN